MTQKEMIIHDINALFSNTSVPQSTTLSNLGDIKDEIETLMEALAVDIEATQ